MAKLLKGAPVAAAITERTAAEVSSLKERGITPTLAILRVGERDDDVAYEKAAMKRCVSVGIEVRNVVLPADTTTGTLLLEIEKLNGDASVHGVLMFRPLPKSLDEKAACAALSPAKDVDGITAGAMACVYSGSGDGYPPCTAQSCMELLNYYGIDPAGKKAAVVGRSLVIGRPAAMLLLSANATVTVCHTKTADMPSVTKEADIVVAAAGKAGTITGQYLRAGQTVLDVGIHQNAAGDGLCGDVLFEEAEKLVEAITPVPGGVGSVTTAVLASHVVEAAERCIR